MLVFSAVAWRKAVFAVAALTVLSVFDSSKASAQVDYKRFDAAAAACVEADGGSECDAAISIGTDMIKRGPRVLGYVLYLEMLTRRGSVYATVGDDFPAIDDFSTIIDLLRNSASLRREFTPRLIVALDMRGGLYEGVNAFDMAIIDYQYLLTLNPDPKMRADVEKSIADDRSVLAKR